MTECESLWEKAKIELAEKLDRDSYDRYLAGIVPIKLDHESNTLHLGVLNDLLALWLDGNYKTLVAEVASELLRKAVGVRFESGYAAAPPRVEPEKPTALNRSRAREVTPSPFRPDFTFSDYVVGNSNRIAFAASTAVAKNIGKAYNPLFLYGGVGLGKTHLLQGIANAVYERRKRAKIHFLTSEEFLNDYVEALQTRKLPAFRARYRGCDVLLIDDVHFFEGKVGLQEEFFHTFNALYNNHKQIVLASDRMPQEIPGLEKRLVSRFDWGLSAEIMMPDEETRLAILAKKQERQKVKVPDEVLRLIAERIPSNIRTLESALSMIIMHVTAFGGEMTRERAEGLLRDKFDVEMARTITITNIQRKVAEYYDIRVADMTSKKRPNHIAFPRMVAMYLSRQLTDESLPQIGEAFNRNHATIMHAVSRIETRMDQDESFSAVVGTLSRQLRSQ
jgi:chromosomal replication initiator protein